MMLLLGCVRRKGSSSSTIGAFSPSKNKLEGDIMDLKSLGA